VSSRLSEGERVRRLAELKSFLEAKVRSLEEELTRTRELMDLVDALLVEGSFKKLEPKVVAEVEREVSRTPLSTIDGVKLADFIVEGNTIRVEPSPELKLEVSYPPLSSFLINKVLEPMRKKDLESVRAGEKSEDEAFSYEISQEGNSLKALTLKNFGDERRLVELKSAIKWTLRRMYERSIGKTR